MSVFCHWLIALNMPSRFIHVVAFVRMSFLKKKKEYLSFLKLNKILALLCCCCSVAKSCLTIYHLINCSMPGSMGFPGKNSGVGCHFLLQGILPRPGIKLVSPALAGDSLPLSHQKCPNCMYIPFLSIHWILFIHLSMMEVWVASVFWVLLKMFPEYGCTDHLFITLLSVLLGAHPALQLLDHMVILFLIFGETVTLFSTVAAPRFKFLSCSRRENFPTLGYS